MISIILPIYNAAQNLHRCIDSILTQSYPDFELLLINDGSTDNSGTICDEYAIRDSRIRVYHKVNGGVSSARNLGLDNARGEYVTFCDADDYVGTDWLSVYNNAIIEGVDLAIQGFSIIDEGKMIKKTLPKELSDTIDAKRKLIFALMNQGVFGYLWVKFFRREIIEENHIRFDTNSAFREDEQFFSKYLEYATTFKCIDKENYYYFLPTSGKIYKGDAYYSLLPIFQSLDVIFDKKLSVEICKLHYENIKDAAVQYILQGKVLSAYHLDLYKRIVIVLGYTRGVKNIILNTLILQNHQAPLISKWILSVLHKLTEK